MMEKIIKVMLERLHKAEFNCAKCNKRMSDIHCSDHKCTNCGMNVGVSASMQVESIFKGIDVPPELMTMMKEGLVANLK